MNEFLDAYSDDQIYLMMIKDLVASHPTEAAVPENIKYSSFCRLWAVMMVGSIEAMIKVWDTGEEFWTDVRAYFDKQSNEDRVGGLQRAFTSRGLTTDVEVFKDFLAIKHIRNSYIHSNWSDAQKVYVRERNFPGNMMEFEERHLIRMQEVYFVIMNCLGTINALGLSATKT